jgi:hypothetical protein
MSVLLITYPRSGQHLLREHILQMLDVECGWTHSLLKKHDFDKTITIIRDPKEAMASWISMELYYEEIDPTRKKQTLDFYLEAAKKEYALFYNYAKKNIDIFIQYLDLIDNPKKIILFLSKELKVNIKNNNFTNTIIDNPDSRHLVSSKNVLQYNSVLEKINNVDLKIFEDFYNDLDSMCIKDFTK